VQNSAPSVLRTDSACGKDVAKRTAAGSAICADVAVALAQARLRFYGVRRCGRPQVPRACCRVQRWDGY